MACTRKREMKFWLRTVETLRLEGHIGCVVPLPNAETVHMAYLEDSYLGYASLVPLRMCIKVSILSKIIWTVVRLCCEAVESDNLIKQFIIVLCVCVCVCFRVYTPGCMWKTCCSSFLPQSCVSWWWNSGDDMFRGLHSRHFNLPRHLLVLLSYLILILTVNIFYVSLPFRWTPVAQRS